MRQHWDTVLSEANQSLRGCQDERGREALRGLTKNAAIAEIRPLKRKDPFLKAPRLRACPAWGQLFSLLITSVLCTL